MKTKLNKNMKSKNGFIGEALLIVIIIVGIGAAAMYFFGSEKVKASVSVFKNKAQNSFVESAGKSEVAEEIAIRNIQDLRDKLIKLKSLKRTMQRHIDNENTPEASKAHYKDLIEKLTQSEVKAELAYKESGKKLEELRAKLSIIDAEIAMAKTASCVMGKNNFNAPLKNEINEILNSLNKDLDDANAQLDVVILESQMQ